MTRLVSFAQRCLLLTMAMAWCIGADAKSEILGDSASYTRTFQVPFNIKDHQGRDRVKQLLESLPFVRAAEAIHRSAPQVTKSSSGEKSLRSYYLLVQFSHKTILKSVVAEVIEEVNSCSSVVGADKDSCTEHVKYEIQATQNAYGTLVESRKYPNWGSSLKLSFNYEPAEVEGQSQSKLISQLEIKNRSYMGMLRYLGRKGLLSKMPTEEELKLAFLAWARQL